MKPVVWVLAIAAALGSVIFWAIGQAGPNAKNFRGYVLVPVLLIVFLVSIAGKGKKKERSRRKTR
jgi:hypothetical protein